MKLGNYQIYIEERIITHKIPDHYAYIILFVYLWVGLATRLPWRNLIAYAESYMYSSNYWRYRRIRYLVRDL